MSFMLKHINNRMIRCIISVNILYLFMCIDKCTISYQEADIYAGAIILKEIFARNGPYTEQEDDMEPDGKTLHILI